MRTESYISYAQMHEHLDNNSFTSMPEAVASAKEFYSKAGLASAHLNPFPPGMDIIMLSDEKFLQMCEGLPFLLSPGAYTDSLQFNSLVPPGYECYITMHLNNLPASSYDHDFFEICYVWKGSCVQKMNTQEAVLQAGDFLIIPPEFRHELCVNDKDSVIFCIMVKKSAFKHSYGAFLTQQNVLSIFLRRCLFEDSHRSCLLIHTIPGDPTDNSVPGSTDTLQLQNRNSDGETEETSANRESQNLQPDQNLYLKRILKHLTHECYIEQSIFCDFATGILNQLFSYMILYGEMESDLLGLPDRMEPLSLLRDIQENYQNITLKELAEKYHFAEESLSRMIRKMTGKTFTALLRDVRIEQACFLLANTDYHMEKISELIGYREYSSFYRIFRKETGLSPGEYRLQNK